MILPEKNSIMYAAASSLITGADPIFFSSISKAAMKIRYDFKLAAVGDHGLKLKKAHATNKRAVLVRMAVAPGPKSADKFRDWERNILDGVVSRKKFQINSYDTNADMLISFDTILKHLQEAVINHIRTTGFLGGAGFGQTPEMSAENLSWVVTKMQVVVDNYPAWGDAVDVDTWINPSRRNGFNGNWVVRDTKSNGILIRASSLWVMNKTSRKLCEIPENIRSELQRCLFDASPFVNERSARVTKLNDEMADYVQKGLKPKWTDLDFNLHVNNVKYIDWILESIPESLLRSHKISSMALEYRRECGLDNVLDSLTAAIAADSHNGSSVGSGDVSCQHLLRLEDGAEVLRGRTKWMPKRSILPKADCAEKAPMN